MLNLKSFKGRELQNFNSLLQIFIEAGITDALAIQVELLNHVSPVTLKVTPAKVATSENPAYCMVCGQGVMLPVVNTDGLQILGCPKCRYSKIVGD